MGGVDVVALERDAPTVAQRELEPAPVGLFLEELGEARFAVEAGVSALADVLAHLDDRAVHVVSLLE